MTTPRQTFESYNRYRPPAPNTPWYNPIPQEKKYPFRTSNIVKTAWGGVKQIPNLPILREQTNEQVREAQDWARSPSPYFRILDPNLSFTEKFMEPGAWDKTFGEIPASFLEEAKLYDPNFNREVEDPNLLQRGLGKISYNTGPYNKNYFIDKALNLNDRDSGREVKDLNFLQTGVIELQKSLARNSAIGEHLAGRQFYRSAHKALGAEGLAMAGSWAFGLRKLAYGTGVKYSTPVQNLILDGLKNAARSKDWAKNMPKPISFKESIQSNSSKIGGLSSSASEIPGRVLGGSKYVFKKVADSVAEPMIPNNFLGNFSLELGAETAFHAAVGTYGDSKKYHNANVWTAIASAALTGVGGLALVGAAAQALRKSPDKLLNVAKNELLRATDKYHASSLTPSMEADAILKQIEDDSQKAISLQGKIYNEEAAPRQLIIEKSINDMSSPDFNYPPNVAKKTIFTSDGAFYPAGTVDDLAIFKKTLLKLSPNIESKGYEEGLFRGDIKFDNLWEKSKTTMTVNGKKTTVVDLLHLEKNISTQNVIADVVTYAGIGEDIPVGLGATANNIDFIKKYFDPEVSSYIISTHNEISKLNRSDNRIQKLVNNYGTAGQWNTQIKPLIKYELAHSQKVYNDLPEASKVSIRAEFVKKWGIPSTNTTEIDELIFHPYYYFEPRLAGDNGTGMFIGKDGQSDPVIKYFKDKNKFDERNIDDLLDNPYIKMFALSKLLREHKVYFEFAENTSRIEDLISQGKLSHTPLENALRDRNLYHGYNKLIDPDYGVTTNENVLSGLKFLKNLHENKIRITENGKIREISPYYEMPDTMLWGSKHSQFSVGNIELMQTAVDLNINIPVHGGPASWQDVGKNSYEGYTFYNKNILNRAEEHKLEGLVATTHRTPISEGGRKLGSYGEDPDFSLNIGAIDPQSYLSLNGQQMRGQDVSTMIGGGSFFGSDDWDNVFKGELSKGLSEEEATASAMHILRFENLNKDIPFVLFNKEIMNATTALKLDPTSNAAVIDRLVGRSSTVTGVEEGMQFMLPASHMYDSEGLIGWSRFSSMELSITKPDGEKYKVLGMQELQNEGNYVSPDIDTGVDIPFNTNEPFSVKDNINTFKNSAEEFSNMAHTETRARAELDRKEFPALERPYIAGGENQSLFGIFSTIRSKHHSINILNNFDTNIEMIKTNDTQLSNLDNVLGDKIHDYNLSSYASFKSISDTNRNPLPKVDNEISFSGGKSDAIDEDTKAFMFATLEYYIKSIVAPHVSWFYKNGKSAISPSLKHGLKDKPVLKELLLDMGYEKLHDWNDWKAKDWVLKNNKEGTLGEKIVSLFEYLGTDSSKKKFDFQIEYEHPTRWKSVPLNLSDEFGNFKLITNKEDPSFVKFISDESTDEQVMPWIKKAELIKFFNAPVDKSSHEYYTKRFRAQLYAHTSNYTSEKRRVFHLVKEHIEKAITTGHDYIAFPTGDEVINRNLWDASEKKGAFFRKLYDKRIPNTISHIMKEQYDVDVKIDKDFWKNTATTEEAPQKWVDSEYTRQLKKEGVLTTINENISIMKIPKKILDDYEKLKKLPKMTFYKTDDGEIRGLVNFKTDGKAMVFAFEKSDLRTAIHEMGHILRRDLDDAELKIVNKYFDITDGTWTRESEERFANALEDYYVNNKIPDPSLTAPFRKLLKIIGYFFKTHVYADLIHGKQKAKFDKLLETLLPDIPDNEASRAFLKSDEMIATTSRMAEAFHITVDEAKSAMATVQARALAWADETGGNPSDWWEKRGFDIGDEQQISLDDYKKLNGDVIDMEAEDIPITLPGSQKFQSVLDKVIDLVRRAPKERDKLQAEKSKKLSNAVARMHNTLARHNTRSGNGVDDPQQTLAMSRGQLQGTSVNNAVFDPIAELGTHNQAIPKAGAEASETVLADEINVLYNEIILQARAGKITPLDAENATKALTEILLGNAPNNYQIKLLGRTFGEEGARLGMLARKKRSNIGPIAGATPWGIIDDLFKQTPLASLSSIDFSAIMRQSWAVTLDITKARLTARATVQMLQSFLSGNRAKYLHQAIVTDPHFPMFEKSGLDIIEPDTVSQATEYRRAFGKSEKSVKERELISYFDPEVESGEEVFGGGRATFAKLFPVLGQLIKMSERAYTTYLNLVRFELVKLHYLAAKKRGFIHSMDPDLKKPPIEDLERIEQINKGNIDVAHNDQYFTPEEKGYQLMDDYEVVAISDLANIATGAGRVNQMYTLDDAGVIKPKNFVARALSFTFWSPKLVVSRFKMITGFPLFEIRNVGRVGVHRKQEPLSANIRTYLKRTKSGKPYWAGIELTGTAFFGNSKIAKMLKGTRFYNGEGFEVGLGQNKKVIKVPDLGIRLMLIPQFISSSLAALTIGYGIKRHIETNNINGFAEFNPNSSDFGKVTIGNTRFDVFGGYGTAVRFITNMYSGRKISSGTEREREMERIDIIENFLRSKASPPIGVLYSALVKGTDYTGEKFEWSKDLWDLMISMNVQDTYEMIANAVPSNAEESLFGRLATNMLKAVGVSTGIGAQTYWTADDVVRGYFVNTDGTIYRYNDLEGYLQTTANLLIPETGTLTGSLSSKEKTMDEIMSIWLEELPEAEGTRRGDLNSSQIADARLYLLQRLVTQDSNGSWSVADKGVIKKAMDAETREVDGARLGYALLQQVISTTDEFEDTKNGMYNQKYGAGEPPEDKEKKLDPLYIAKKEYLDIVKAARDRRMTSSDFDPTIYDPLKKAWEDKYAPNLSALKDENGNFTEAAIAAIENDPTILNRYVTEEWKHTLRNINRSPMPYGIILGITELGVNKDGTRSSYSLYAWEKWVLPQILREEHIKTYNFASMRSGMLDIPVAKDHKLTPELLQKMVYYNIYINVDGTTSYALPIGMTND